MKKFSSFPVMHGLGESARVDVDSCDSWLPKQSEWFLHQPARRFGFALLFAAQLLPLSGQFAPAGDRWSGSVRCVLEANTAEYARTEEQTWKLTGGEPRKYGDIYVYPATWSAKGKGSMTRVQPGAQTVTTQWNVDVPEQPVQLAVFVRASDGRLIFRQEGPRMKVTNAI